MTQSCRPLVIPSKSFDIIITYADGVPFFVGFFPPKYIVLLVLFVLFLPQATFLLLLLFVVLIFFFIVIETLFSGRLVDH